MGTTTAWSGDFAAAASVAAEAQAVSEATGTRIAPYGALLLACLRGREAEAAPLIEATINEAGAGGQGIAVTYARWAAAILFNGLGRYDEARGAALQASQDTPRDVCLMWALPELIEASTRSGNTQLATDALKRLAETTRPSGTDFGLGMEARSRALVSKGEVAEGFYREAIDRLGRTRLRPELARAHLLYGEWLRRQNRRADARAQLRTAHEMLTTMGIEGFAERARHELLATGETVCKRTVETPGALTPQEAYIARLARDGRTNPEIGAQLFLSARSNGTCARRSRSSASARAGTCPGRCRTSDRPTGRSSHPGPRRTLGHCGQIVLSAARRPGRRTPPGCARRPAACPAK